MNRLSVFLFLIIHTSIIFGQGIMEPYWLYDNHYLADLYLINPAFAGRQNYTRALVSSYRENIQHRDSPAVHLASIHGRIGAVRNAIGGLVFADYNGPFQTTGFKLDYVHTVPFNSKNTTNLSFGLGGMIFSKNIKLDNNISYPTINGKIKITPDVNAGALFVHKNLYIGISASQMLENSFKFSMINYTPPQTYRNYYLQTGYRIMFDFVEIEPSIVVGHNAASNNIGNFIDVNLELVLSHLVFLFSHRLDGFVSLSFLYRIPKFELGVSAGLFSVNPSDAIVRGIGLRTVYTFLPNKK